MTEKTEGTIAALAAIFVLFTAMMDPRISAVLSLVFLIALAVYKFKK